MLDGGPAAFRPGRDDLHAVPLASRVFDLGVPDAVERFSTTQGFHLTPADAIGDRFLTTPPLDRAVVFVEDHDPEDRIGPATWIFEAPWREAIVPDPSLPPIFDLPGYEVGWTSPPGVRGDIAIRPLDDRVLRETRCAYDREETTGWRLCSVRFLYPPDPTLVVEVRVWDPKAPDTPLRDFAEVAARVEALLRCLDVTEAVRAGVADPAAPAIAPADIEPGGRCRSEPVG